MLVVIFIIAVIVYRVIVSMPLFQNPSTRSLASFIANITGAVIQLIIIMILGKVYEKFALLITDWGTCIRLKFEMKYLRSHRVKCINFLQRKVFF